ncbi:MAG: hypothetical protein AB9860_05975 [Methanomassiliicoccales archaeon]
MVWEDVRWKDALRTNYMPGVPKEVQLKRKVLIKEAISWTGGSQTNPNRIYMNPCSDGTAVYFEKPGKEAVANAKGKVKNPNDMRPIVELNGSQPKNASFTDVWSDLTEIAYVDMGAFRTILLLIYRSAFLIDHRYDDDMCLRYMPDPEIMDCIKEMNSLVGYAVSLKSVERLLRFIDVLGWNEDVKYIESNKNGIERTGRVNTLLTCIKIPHDTVMILKRHDERVSSGISLSNRGDEGDASYVPFYNIMQTLLRTRGICVPSTGELFELFSPHLIDGAKVRNSSGTVALRSIQRTID